MSIWEAVIMAVSLCADCLAVTICSSIGLKRLDRSDITSVAVGFAVIQAGFLLTGWAFGNLFVGLIYKISHIIGFLMLMYVGGEMFLEGIKSIKGDDDDARNLHGIKNIIIGGIATSIDALAVGVSQSMVPQTQSWAGFSPLFWAVFIVTAAASVTGMCCGKMLGSRFGHWAEVAGGAVLMGIGVSLLF